MSWPVNHSVRSTLATLFVGVVAQRLLQLAAFLCIGRALGPEGLGVYAQGIAFGALLSVLAGAGVRNVFAREVARSPTEAGAIVRQAVRMRLVAGTGLAAAGTAAAFAYCDLPWFWTLCILQVLPAAFELKNLLDAIGRTRVETRFETATALVQFVLVLAWWRGGGQDLHTLAAIALASRCGYALQALPTIVRLPRTSARVAVPRPGLVVVIGQTLHETLAAADAWIVAICFGTATAGLYAVAVRFATAALLPSVQLARLLLPHLLHAADGGDAARTLRTATRATALVTLPMLAGGTVVAERLCTLPGPEFGAASATLVLALLAGTLQHAAWQRSHALLAARRDRDYGRTLVGPSLLHVAGLFCCGFAANAGTLDTATTAAIAAAVGVIAHTFYLVATGRASLRTPASDRGSVIAAPLAIAAATAAAAALPAVFVDGASVLAAQLLLGAMAFATGLWFFELRGRMHRVGDGLARASGFQT